MGFGPSEDERLFSMAMSQAAKAQQSAKTAAEDGDPQSAESWLRVAELASATALNLRGITLADRRASLGR